jgi:hypothetical protein
MPSTSAPRAARPQGDRENRQQSHFRHVLELAIGLPKNPAGYSATASFGQLSIYIESIQSVAAFVERGRFAKAARPTGAPPISLICTTIHQLLVIHARYSLQHIAHVQAEMLIFMGKPNENPHGHKKHQKTQRLNRKVC